MKKKKELAGFSRLKMLIRSKVLAMMIISVYCTNDEKEVHYRGISIAWRRLISSKSDEIRLEILIVLALADKSMSLCDSHHTKTHEISSDFGIGCVHSWDNCISWPSQTFLLQCHSKSHEYPKSVLYTEMKISLPSGTKSSNIFYKIQFPSSNTSCCWEDVDQFVRLESLFNNLQINEINNSPIARFPSHLYIDITKPFDYSLEVFDPDGDLFECSLSSSVHFFTLNENCQLIFKSPTSLTEFVILIEIEIIEYFEKDKSKIRSRLPYHLIAFLDSTNQTEQCNKSPTIHLKNIENNQIDVLLNEHIQINLISSSECPIEMDECSINSPFHWKTKSQIEKINLNHQNEVEYEFEWIPKTIEQCGFQIHCIRCLDQLGNLNEKCIQISVNGPICQNVYPRCSWSPFSIWSKYNQTLYTRNRICYDRLNEKNSCSLCYGSSIQYQSSLAFLKDFQLMEESILSPTRAYSTIKIILIASTIWTGIFLLSICISIYLTIKILFK